MTHYLPFFVSLLIGLLIGIEREKAHPDRSKMGVRSFVLVALLGVLSSWLESGPMALLLAFVSLMLITASFFLQFRSSSETRSHDLTTEFAAVTVFCLGYLAHRDLVGAAFLGPLVALILVSKGRLHHFAAHMRVAELEAATVLFLLATGVLGLAADRAIDPWGLFNPRQFGMIVLILAAFEFVSYVAMKFMSDRKGALVTGALGGLVSSTAVMLAVSRDARQSPETWKRSAVSAAAATATSLLEVVLLVSLVSGSLASHLLIRVLLMGAIAVFAVFWLLRRATDSSSSLIVRSPLDLRGVLRLAVLLTAILIVVGWTQRTFGSQGTQIIALLTGLFELHGFSLATATLHSQGQMDSGSAVFGIEIAILGSFISKVAVAWMVARGRFAIFMTGFTVLLAGVLFVVQVFI